MCLERGQIVCCVKEMSLCRESLRYKQVAPDLKIHDLTHVIRFEGVELFKGFVGSYYFNPFI